MQFKDLSITIKCEPRIDHHWMAFASWYSIKKRISNCSIFIETDNKKNFFNWTSKLGVKIFKKTNSEIKIDPNVIAVREFEGDFEIVSSKSDVQKTFVDYKFGCGKFDFENEKQRAKCPFYNSMKVFSKDKMTVNEVAVLRTWEQCYGVFFMVGGL